MSEGGMDHIKVDLAELAPGTWELRIGGSLDWSNFAKVETAIEAIFAEIIRIPGAISLTSSVVTVDPGAQLAQYG